jgi:hypothetical protein
LQFLLGIFLAARFVLAAIDVLRQENVEANERFGDFNMLRGQAGDGHENLHSLLVCAIRLVVHLPAGPRDHDR